MIPEFDENGNLLPGNDDATFREVIERFGTPRSLKRQLLSASLEGLFDFVKDHAVRVYIDGSYVTAKLAPNDVDLIVVLPEDFPRDPQVGRRLVRIVNNKQANYLHIFAFYLGRQDERLEEMLAWFTRDRDGNRKGIVCVEVENDQERPSIATSDS